MDLLHVTFMLQKSIIIIMLEFWNICGQTCFVGGKLLGGLEVIVDILTMLASVHANFSL